MTGSSAGLQTEALMTPLSGMTCGPSQVNSTEEEQVALWLDSHAPITAWPESGPESSASTGNCGTPSRESFTTLDPNGLHWRTSAVSLFHMLIPDGDGIVKDEHGRSIAFLPDSPSFLETWPTWGSMRNGACCQQVPFKPATGGRESSFWPTSRAEDSESTGAHRGNLDTLTSATENWPTPDASPKRGSNRRYLEGDNRTGRLLSVEAADWSTPNAHDATLWRTPAAGHPLKGGSQPPEKRLAGGHNLDLQDQAEFWQTPATDSFRSRGGDRVDEMGLDQQARFWPTPAQRDHRDPNNLSYQERSGSTKGEQLNNYVAHQWKTPHGLQLLAGDPGGGGEFADQATNWEPSLPARQIHPGLPFWIRYRILRRLCLQLRQRLPSPYNKARSIFKRKLNPNFVDFLMGWPDGWSSEDRVFSVEEMASYLYRQRQYLEYLLRG